jgi:Uma2 family endonuclease
MAICFLRKPLGTGLIEARLDSKNQRVEIYRQGQDVEILQSPASLSGEDVLPGFVLDLKGIL